jgi:hypothetical protein
MKNHMRLLLPLVCLAIAACSKEEVAPEGAKTEMPATPAVAAAVPADNECDDCRWETFLNKQVPVDMVECTNSQNQLYHCHLRTRAFKPQREVTVMHDQATGGYSFKLETRESGQEADRMECANLVPDSSDARIIQGTCLIQNSEHGIGVHHFKATVQPQKTPPYEAEIMFEFRHEAFGAAAQGEPVHNGEGHAHIP